MKELTHSDNKPCQCHTCQKAFTKKSNLSVHERTHSGKEPYQCQICGKAFGKKCHLAEHERTHIGTNHISVTQVEELFPSKVT